MAVTARGAPAAARAAEIAFRALGPALVVFAVAGIAVDAVRHVPEFLVLAIVARALRVPYGGVTLDLEAAAIFPAILMSGSWETGPILAAVSALAVRAIERRGRLTAADADDVVDLVLAYGASSFFLASLSSAASERLELVLLYGAALLVFFFARIVLGVVHASARKRAPAPVLLRAAAYQFVALLLLSPAVALIVILHPLYGPLGSFLAFTSVALVSASLRNVARARSRTEELARQNRELVTLREVSALFAGAGRDEEAFERLFRLLSETHGVDALAAVSYEEEPDGRSTVVLAGDVTLERRAFLDWLARERELDSPFLPSLPAPRAFGAERELVLSPRCATQVRLPLQTPELIAGLLVVESRDDSFAEPGGVQELAVIADHVALSLQDRGLRRQMQAVNKRLQERAATLQRILEVSGELKAHLTVDHVLSAIVRAVSGSLGFDVVLLSLYDRADGLFTRRAQVGLDARWEEMKAQRLPREEVTRWFSERYRISKSYFASHIDRADGESSRTRLERRHRTTGTGVWHPEDLLLIPLTAGDQLIGVLQVDQPKSGNVPKLEDVQALEIFANQAVTAIQSARAYETTRQMSVRDSLTEAYNHRYFQETLYREMTRHERSGQTLAVLMLDIDDFKKINDRYGHPVGDVVLRGLVDELLKGVREMDTVARYGGEEFAVICPETTPEQAAIVADRLRSRVAARFYAAPEVPRPLSVTVSVGLACFPGDAASKRAVIEKADQALYEAKRRGKDRVVTAAALREAEERAGSEPDGVLGAS